MLWSDARVAGFAQAAGFAGDALTVAVAVALATSDGDDAYRYVGIPGPWTDQRGLWGIDVVQYPDLAALDLMRPAVNASAAWGLYHADGRSFRWSVVMPDAISADVVQRARDAARNPTTRQVPNPGGADKVAGSPLAVAHARFQQIRSRLTTINRDG